MVSPESAALGAEAARRLALAGRYEIGPGLTDAETARVEDEHGFEFADDHRTFVQAGLPFNSSPGTGHAGPWPDWRNGSPEMLRRQLDWPVEGVLFDVRVNSFWHDGWGPRPASTGQALRIAEEHLARVPRMVPVYGHRYLPAGRGGYGHPVLSIYQADIIIYGTDLATYIDREFGSIEDIPGALIPTRLSTVPFWSEFL